MTAPRRVAGMTLLELLLAMILLGIGATIVYAAMRTSLGVAARGDLVSQQQDWMRTTATLLHRQLVAAQPLPLVQPGPGDAPVVFVGEPDHMRFASATPAYLGAGSIRVHELRVVMQPTGQELHLWMRPRPGARGVAPVGPERLAAMLGPVRFRYRGMDPETGRAGPWLERWTSPEQLPVQVAVEVATVDGRQWPPLLVAPVRGGHGVQGGR